MGQESTASEQLQSLLANPNNYQDIVTIYDSELDCFRELREEAKRSLDSFEDYVEFYKIIKTEGPAGDVEHYLKQNAVRILKNMVLRDSLAGRRYQLESATELHDRIEAFRELGIEEVTPNAVVATILEYVYDSDDQESRLYEITSSLLSDAPEEPTETVEMLVLTRFVSAAQSLDIQSPAFRKQSNKLFAQMPDSLLEDDRSVSDVKTAAEDASYSDPDKVDLFRLAVARSEEPDLDLLEDFLYHTTRDVVERHRHATRDNPWRGEFQLALRQCNCLVNVFGDRMDSGREIRLKSYRKIILGELAAGGRWRSLRDPNHLPESNFFGAARHFAGAASQIRDVDSVRYVKYISRAFRNQALAVRQTDRQIGPAYGWDSCRRIHGAAVDVLSQTGNEHCSGERLNTAIIESMAFHLFRGHRAAAVAEFSRGKPDSIEEHVDRAYDHLDGVPVYVNTNILEILSELAEALRYESKEEFDQALAIYGDVESPMLPTEKRLTLAKIKQEIKRKNGDKAVELAVSEFGSNSPLVTAIQIVFGRKSSSPSIKPPILEGLAGVTRETKWEFVIVVHLASNFDDLSEALTDHIHELLMGL